MAVVGDIANAALDFFPEDRLEIGRTLVESVADSEKEAVREGIQRIGDIVSGNVPGMTEEAFRSALG